MTKDRIILRSSSALFECLQYFIMRTIFLLLALTLLFQPALPCHQTCSTCTTTLYSACTSCANQQPILKANGYSSNLIGVCSDIDIKNLNIFGLFFLLLMIASWIAFPDEEIMHFAMLVQSIGLFYLVQILWSKETHYILSAFTYLMPFIKIEYTYNTQNASITSFKSMIFFETADILANLSLIGSINLLLLLLMLGIPFFKSIRKRINKERANCLPDSQLDKILMVVNFIYLMMIQQTMLSIYFGLKNGPQNIGGIALTVLYFLSLIFFIINQWFYPFPFFRSKFTQLNILTIKALAPIFMVSESDTHYILFVFLIILFTVDLLITNKNRNNSAFNRLLLYKVYCVLALILLGGFYCIELIQNSESLSKTLGIISTLALCGVLYLFAMEICLQLKEYYCSKEKPAVNIALEMTQQEFRVSKNVFSLDLNSIPLQKQENEQGNNSILMLPLKNVSDHQLHTFVADSQKMENSSVKFTDKSSTNRLGSNIVEEKNQQVIQNFQEIEVKISERPEYNQNTLQDIPPMTKTTDPLPKRKPKKRRQKQ